MIQASRQYRTLYILYTFSGCNTKMVNTNSYVILIIYFVTIIIITNNNNNVEQNHEKNKKGEVIYLYIMLLKGIYDFNFVFVIRKNMYKITKELQ